MLQVDRPRDRAVLAFAGFLAFFLIYLGQLPWNDALPGNNDVFMGIVVGKILLNEFLSLLGLVEVGTAMYPVDGVLPYGESAIGLAAIFTVFHSLGLSDVVAWYLNISILFAFTGLAAYVFAGRFMKSFAARCFAGFAFTCSNMTFAHLDEPYAFFYIMPLLSLNFVVRAFREQDARHLAWAGVLGGLQIYFSVYVFVYQTALLGCVGLYYWLRPRHPMPVRDVAVSVGLYGMVAAPLLLFYVFGKNSLNLMTPTPSDFFTYLMSWTYHDLMQALPGNLLYGPSTSMPLTWDLVRHQNFIGLLVTGAALWALSRRGEHRAVFAGTAVLGLVFAIGPMLMLGASTAQDVTTEHYYTAFLSSGIGPAPLYPFYDFFPIMSFHRVPIRGYVLVLLAVSFLAAIALDVLLRRTSNRRASFAIVALFFGIHFIENAPFPLPSYRLGPLLEIPTEYEAFMQGKKDALVVDLPSRMAMSYRNWDASVFSDPKAFVRADPSAPRLEVIDASSMSLSHQPLFNYSREFLYMNWQTQHKANIIGGANGYFPVSRLIYDRWLEDLPHQYALEWLRNQGVDYIVYHKQMLLPGETDILPQLSESPLLSEVFTGEQIVVFEFAFSRLPL